MSRKTRVAKRILLVLVLVVALLTLVVSFMLGPVIRTAVETLGPAVAGVPIQVEKVRVFPWRGIARIDGLVVGPPAGYAANLAELRRFSLDLQVSSLFGDTVVVREIIVSGPEVTYELSGLESNVGALLAGLGGDGETEQPKAAEPSKPAKKVVVEHFLFEDGKVRLATTLTGGKGIVLPLPKVELHDIGKPKEGVSALTVVRRTTVAVSVAVLTTVRDGVVGIGGLGADAVKAIAGSAGAGLQTAGKLAGKALVAVGEGVEVVAGAAVEGAKAVGEVAAEGAKVVGEGAKAVGETALEGAKAAGGLAAEGAKAVGGAAAEGAKAVGGLAAEGAKAVGGAAAEGAKAVGGALRSVGGLFGGKGETPPKTPAEPKE